MAETLRVGMIGTDTSHAIAFTRLFHDKEATGHVPGVRVVAAYPSFSPDIEGSVSRVDNYKRQLAHEYGVDILDSIEAVVEQSDGIMIESLDGRRHLPEFRKVAPSGKPVFIDKPFTASLADAKEIVRLAREHDVPCWSASSLRFDSAIAGAARDIEHCGKVIGCDAFSPASLEKTNPGWFWYGIHGVEILYTFMGRGCRQVRCMSTPDGDVAVGVWDDGRLGTMRGIRTGKKGYGARVMCEKQAPKLVMAANDFYAQQMKAVAESFRTRRPAVPLAETLELCAFIDAALKSSKQESCDVTLDLSDGE